MNLDILKELRARTGAGVLDCKKALVECADELEKAVDYLREKGLAKAAKKVDRVASQGRVFSYIHTSGKIGVLVELDCETDFVARTDEFLTLGHELSLQIAASNPQYVTAEDVPAHDLDREREVYRNQAREEGKPEAMLDRIADGKINKFYEENCLVEQNYIRDTSRKIKDMIIENIAKMGENIVVRRFARYTIGD